MVVSTPCDCEKSRDFDIFPEEPLHEGADLDDRPMLFRRRRRNPDRGLCPGRAISGSSGCCRCRTRPGECRSGDCAQHGEKVVAQIDPTLCQEEDKVAEQVRDQENLQLISLGSVEQPRGAI
ncbi:MAG: hypothetical protein ACREFH_04930, partial [Stellaceae bacterium]